MESDRGMEIQAVGMTVSYSEESQKLLNMRNEGAMLSDPTVREGYVQGAVARGLRQREVIPMVPWPVLWEWEWLPIYPVV